MKFRTKLINQNRQSTNFICHCTRNLKTLKNSVLKIKVIHSQPGLQNKTSPQINKQDKIKKRLATATAENIKSRDISL